MRNHRQIEDIVDIEGVGPPSRPDRRSQATRGRPWLAVQWRCCSVYSRIYRNHEATAYVGYCPKCGRQVRVTISPDGVPNRFFEAY